MLALQAPHMQSFNESDDNDTDDEDLSFSDDIYGSRPQLPHDLPKDKDYDKILSIFYACTEEDPLKRPSAKTVLSSLQE